MAKTIELAAKDGHKFAAYVAEPAGKPRGAIVVVQEIFGCNAHIKEVADGFAKDGYLAIAPHFFDRFERGFDHGYTQADIDAGRTIAMKTNWDNTMADAQAAVDHVKSAGKVAVVGYCWGGTAAWLAAARLTGIAATSPFYGGGVAGFVGEKPKVPVMAHWGETDHAIPLTDVKKVTDAHPEITSYIYPAGHGFTCDHRGSYHAESSKLARERTLEFFGKHVG